MQNFTFHLRTQIIVRITMVRGRTMCRCGTCDKKKPGRYPRMHGLLRQKELEALNPESKGHKP